MRELGRTASGEELISCAVCDGTETRPRYRKFDGSIVQCRACGLVYVNPRHPREVVWKRYSPDYFTREYLPAQGIVNNQVDLPHFDSRFAQILRLLAAEVGGHGRLFELGAGAGLFLKAAERAGWQVRGAELSTAACDWAREVLGVTMTPHSAETIPVDGEPYDAVVLFDVIEHLYDPVAALARLRKICRPGAVIAVSTPNFDALSRLALGVSWSIISPLEHLYYFQERTLARALEVAGFRDVRFERHHGDWSVYDTMNARSTHAPGTWRARKYAEFIEKHGQSQYRRVQAWGRGDILMAIARA